MRKYEKPYIVPNLSLDDLLKILNERNPALTKERLLHILQDTQKSYHEQKDMTQ